MLCAGDEIARTQGGNNNAYCQDNEISWLDWKLGRAQDDLLAFTRALIRLRREHPVWRRRQFLYGRRIRGSELKDLAWFRPDGKEMTEDDWNAPHTRCLGLRLSGDAIVEVDDMGDRIVDDTFVLLLNAHHEPVPFVMPAHRRGVRWEALLDTRERDGRARRRLLRGGTAYTLAERSAAVLRMARSREGVPARRAPRRARVTEAAVEEAGA
jgi:glycogen operon protein